jgi:hypothetical protein
MGHDKWVGLEERLRAVEGNNLIHHMIAVKVRLVPNMVVSKEFRVPDFVKYTRLEFPYTHLLGLDFSSPVHTVGLSPAL